MRRRETELERGADGQAEERSAAVLRQKLETGRRRQSDQRHGQYRFEIRRSGKWKFCCSFEGVHCYRYATNRTTVKRKTGHGV